MGIACVQHFQAVTSAQAGQVLRYCRDERAEPMWAIGKPVPSKIPDCERCGACRRFEFQILPQMLAFLGMDDTVEDTPDWCDTTRPRQDSSYLHP